MVEKVRGWKNNCWDTN